LETSLARCSKEPQRFIKGGIMIKNNKNVDKRNKVADVAGTICGIVLLACISILAIFGTIKAIMLLFGR